jgi:hypothetical protein
MRELIEFSMSSAASNLATDYYLVDIKHIVDPKAMHHTKRPRIVMAAHLLPVPDRIVA